MTHLVLVPVFEALWFLTGSSFGQKGLIQAIHPEEYTALLTFGCCQWINEVIFCPISTIIG